MLTGSLSQIETHLYVSGFLPINLFSKILYFAASFRATLLPWES